MSSGAPSGLDVYSKAAHDAVPSEQRDDALVELHHCILASAAGGATALVNDASDAGTLVSDVIGAENIIVSFAGSVASGAVISVNDPQLDALADNGGATWTMALPSSQTVAPTSALPCDDLAGGPLLTDQRGAAAHVLL
mgnify:FL=1